MTTQNQSARRCLLALFATAAVLFTSTYASAGGAQVIVINVNSPGVGFNDPTPAAPVGGNTGTTKGEQRLIAFQHAADLWGQTIDSPAPIFVTAQFTSLGANVLGSAGATFIFRDFGGAGLYPGAEFPGTWYGSALADKRAGVDLNPGFADIGANFSSDFDFYLGLDANHGAKVNLVTVVLHELGHGLNFQTFVNTGNGALAGGYTDIYARYLVDTTNGLHWDQMTNAERQASATKFGRLVWDGTNVTTDVPAVLSLGSPEVRVLAPPSVAGPYQFGTAAFGPAIGSPSVTGNVVAAVDAADAAGPTTTDGCSPFTNAGAVAGAIALIERGGCGFAVKARNATDAGAIGAIIYNQAANAAAAPPGMADDGINGAFVTIPTVSLTRADGLAIAAQAPDVTTTIRVDGTIRAGADELGRARLYAPFPRVAGSSVSHYDTVATRNLLMEPAINSDLTHNLTAPFDLTLELLRDVGWFADADLDGVPNETDCTANSDLRATVVIGGVNTGVPNALFTSGCTITDLTELIRISAKNHGQYVSGVAGLTNTLVKNGVITGAQKGAIQSATAHNKNP